MSTKKAITETEAIEVKTAAAEVAETAEAEETEVKKEPERVSGILVHPTSFPSPYGIGDMGPGAYEFIDFLEE